MELGFKLTNAADEFSSLFHLTSDRTAPIFISTETDTVFILNAHLKGYRRRNIKIDINEDGSLIGISGERQVKETVIVDGKVYKKDTETKGFKKVYRIPDGVILDKIKATFNDDESTLTITMPKKVKGVRGAAIEEVKEKPELVREGSGRLHITDEKSPKEDEGKLIDEEKQEKADDILEINEAEQDQEVVDGTQNEINDEPETCKEVADGEAAAEEGEADEEKRRCKMCLPIVAGSTLLLTLVAFVIQIIRSKRQTSYVCTVCLSLR